MPHRIPLLNSLRDFVQPSTHRKWLGGHKMTKTILGFLRQTRNFWTKQHGFKFNSIYLLTVQTPVGYWWCLSHGGVICRGFMSACRGIQRGSTWHHHCCLHSASAGVNDTLDAPVYLHANDVAISTSITHGWYLSVWRLQRERVTFTGDTPGGG